MDQRDQPRSLFAKREAQKFIKMALAEACMSVDQGGGPFGAVIVANGRLVAKAHNQVTQLNDPTAHAEVQAIRMACQVMQTFSLAGCEIYTSCEPCPMCMAAIYWAHLDRVYFCNTQAEAAAIGFDDARIARDQGLPLESREIPIARICPEQDAWSPFKRWQAKADRLPY